MPASPFQIAAWRADGTLCPRCKQARQHPPQRYCAPCLIECGTPPLNIAKEHLQLIRRLRSWAGPDPAKIAREDALARRKRQLEHKRQAEAERRAMHIKLTRLPALPKPAKPKRKRAVNPLTLVKALATPHPEELVGSPPQGEPKRKSYYKPRRKRVPYRSERRYKPRFWTKTL